MDLHRRQARLERVSSRAARLHVGGLGVRWRIEGAGVGVGVRGGDDRSGWVRRQVVT